MQQQKSEKQKVIIFIAFDDVVEHQTEKQENTADECLNGSPEDFAQTWFFQYADVGVGEKIINEPAKWNQQQAIHKLRILQQFRNGKGYMLDIGFTENEKAKPRQQRRCVIAYRLQ